MHAGRHDRHVPRHRPPRPVQRHQLGRLLLLLRGERGFCSCCCLCRQAMCAMCRSNTHSCRAGAGMHDTEGSVAWLALEAHHYVKYHSLTERLVSCCPGAARHVQGAPEGARGRCDGRCPWQPAAAPAGRAPAADQAPAAPRPRLSRGRQCAPGRADVSTGRQAPRASLHASW